MANHVAAQGEFPDRQTGAGGTEDARTVTRSRAVEGNVGGEGEGGSGGGGGGVRWSGTGTESGSGSGSLRRSSSSCSHHRRARQRQSSEFTEPIPAIPQIYLNNPPPNHPTPTSTTTSTTTNNTTGKAGRSGDRPPIILAKSRSLSRSRGRDRGIRLAKPPSDNNNQNATGMVAERGLERASEHLPDFPRTELPLQAPHAISSPRRTTVPMPRSTATDLFLDDRVAMPSTTTTTAATATSPGHQPQPVLHRRSLSRTSYADKRRSLPPELMPRPSTSGGNAPRLQHTARASTDLQRHMDHYNLQQPSRRQHDDAATSVSHAGRRRGFTSIHEHSPLSPRSPEMPQYGRRRPSFGVISPTTKHDHHKPAESASGDSQSVDTVWDELDDLKSRIKKLELTGKLPATSSAAVSGGSSDRPRTATTAPTTIDSSPKREQERKQEPAAAPPLPNPETPTTPAGTGVNLSNIHPLLHNALAKAKPLLNTTLFRSLEATASDALQLAAMTGSAGPQGTTFSAASIINGVTVSDRHVRRKADNMCRNLTDLCLALCEGKLEAPSTFSSPSSIDPAVMQRSPSLRYSRSGIASANTIRPASRLEARRSSILGAPPSSTTSDISPRGSIGDMSSTATYDQQQQSPQYLQAPPLRLSRAPTSRLHHSSRLNDGGLSGNEDEDPTVRPLSRAMTDAGSFRMRAKARVGNESRLRQTEGMGHGHHHHNEDAYEQNHRVGSSSTYGGSETTTRAKRLSSQLYAQRGSPPDTVAEEQGEGEGGDDSTRREFPARGVVLQQRRNASLQFGGNVRRVASGGGMLQQQPTMRRHLALE